MKRLYPILITCMVAFVSAFNVNAQNSYETYEENRWYLDKDSAIAAATAQNKQLFICYGGMACYSTQHVRDLLGTSRLKQIVDDGFVLWYANKDEFYLFGKEIKDYFYKKPEIPMEDGSVIEYPLICVTDKYSNFHDSYGVMQGGKTEAKLLEYFNLHTRYNVTVDAFAGGNVSVSANRENKSLAAVGDTVTLTVHPNEGYLLSEIRAYRTDASSTPVTFVEVTPSARTFVMPACGVTVEATFAVNPDYATLIEAQTLIADIDFNLFQSEANDSEALKNLLADQINDEIRLTGITILPSDITVSDFAEAVRSTEENPSGTDGSFKFTVTLTYGATALTTVEKSGVITAMVRRIALSLLDDTLTVHIVNTGNIETGDLTFALSGDDAFTLSAMTENSFAVDGERDVTLIPREDLEDGTYTVTLTVSGEGFAPATIQITYTVNPTGNDNIAQSKALKAGVQDGLLRVSGLTAGKAWSVYSLTGTLVYQCIADSEEANVKLTARGMYVVVSEKRSVKVFVP